MFVWLPQDLSYHNFADQRFMLGIPNLLNVISNLPFLLTGIWGLRTVPGTAARVFFAGVAATAFGSAWYHLAPGNETLVWDRLPMAVAFMALFSLALGRKSTLWPLVTAGIASVLYWRVTGDLVLYASVQFAPMLALPILVSAFPARIAMVCYAAAKIFELLDKPVFSITGHVPSGHTLKHLAAALAAVCILRWLRPSRVTESSYTGADALVHPPVVCEGRAGRPRSPARAAVPAEYPVHPR